MGCPSLPLVCARVHATTGVWDKVLLSDFDEAVWRLSWSMSGNILAVTDGNNIVTLWKEGVDGQWAKIAQP